MQKHIGALTAIDQPPSALAQPDSPSEAIFKRAEKLDNRPAPRRVEAPGSLTGDEMDEVGW
jgi:hypothetical protein